MKPIGTVLNDLSTMDVVKIIMLLATCFGVFYFAGIQSTRLDVVERNQHRVMEKLEELTKSDYEIKLEIERLRTQIEKKTIGYSLLEERNG